MTDEYGTVHRVTPRERTPEEKVADAKFAAESRARSEQMASEAVQLVKCPTCHASPGHECVWRRRSFGQRVHSPRLYRTPTWKADR